VTDQQLPLSNKSHARIVDDLGERTVRVIDLCERLQVDGLIRLHHRDYDLEKALIQRYTPLFPHLRPEQLLSRGCAITLVSF
jgi:hypothetical protein